MLAKNSPEEIAAFIGISLEGVKAVEVCRDFGIIDNNEIIKK